MALLTVVVMMVLMLVLVLVMVAGAFGIVALLIMMMVMMLRLVSQTLELLLNGVAAFHSSQKLLAIQAIPGSGNNRCSGIVLPQKGYRLGNLLLAGSLGMGEHDAARVGDLVIEELAKILHIHLALLNVGHGGKAVEKNLLGINSLHRLDDIGKLANTGGLDENAIGVILVQHLLECLSEVAHQRAADATAVHLGHLNARVLHKAAVNADLTKLVLNEHQLFSCVCLVQKLFDQRGLASSQKARKNVNLGHRISPSQKKISPHIIPPFSSLVNR